jgi:hypothetical protein
MGEIIRFVPKSERERVRLTREARAIYDSIFPLADAAGGSRGQGLQLRRRGALPLEHPQR